MKGRRWIFILTFALFCIIALGTKTFAKDLQLTPKRLASIGDSMTEAIDAEVYGANHWASWANGYHGFWQWLFGLTNVNSHNQRITKKFGRRERKNFLEARSGADSFDLPGQAQGAVEHQATYVPWLMGHNDICQDNESEIPTDAQFTQNVLEGLNILKCGQPDCTPTDEGVPVDGLPSGATVYVAGMVDVPLLFDIAQDKKALGIVDCEVLWFFTLFELFPCGTVLGPFRTPADRELMRERIKGFNSILKNLVEEFNANDPYHYYFYTDVVFEYQFVERQVSDLDCFHPSAVGQKELSDITWRAMDGPRFQDW